ncbi:MAG: glycosyltransferase [Lachnospiraceae bacterium]|nr:glycosyltransferase [Lachnospiraceae bacterium]
MTFSIIVVCYNAGSKLQKTIESIRSQTEKDYEIIVKDGLSTDGSVEALPLGEDIKVFCRKDKGIYDAMNQAVEHTAGRYLFFLNCGDYFQDETVLARIKQEIEKRDRKPRILYGNILERNTGAYVMSNPQIDDFACYRNVPCHQACFYDRRLLKKRGFRTCYKVRADYEHFLWCYYRARASMEYVPVTVVSYEGGGFSETKENKRRSTVEHMHIVSRYMSREQVMRYRLIMLLTLAPLRTYLASNPVTAELYQGLKRRIYGGKHE